MQAAVPLSLTELADKLEVDVLRVARAITVLLAQGRTAPTREGYIPTDCRRRVRLR